MRKRPVIPIGDGIYECGDYHIRLARRSGGKAGTYNNRTSTLQVTLSVPGGYLVKKMFSFKIGDKKSYDSAEAKCIAWIEAHPFGPPKGIQRLRKKGWRMPPNTVYVGRPTEHGNPFRVGVDAPTPEECNKLFRKMMDDCKREAPEEYEAQMKALRGKNLCCWCPLDKPCHRNVLLELANK